MAIGDGGYCTPSATHSLPEVETLRQLSATRTAAWASTRPKPQSWLTCIAPPFQLSAALNDQLAGLPVRAAVAARIACTSRQPRSGLASSMRAAIPLTTSAANEVPLTVA